MVRGENPTVPKTLSSMGEIEKDLFSELSNNSADCFIVLGA